MSKKDVDVKQNFKEFKKVRVNTCVMSRKDDDDDDVMHM